MIARRDDGIELDTDVNRIDRDLLHAWLSGDAYWALGRDRTTVDRSLEHSRVVAAYSPGPDASRMLAFARMVTDDATFAWLCDVYVAPAARGRGIGTWMIDEYVSLLRDSGVYRFLLATRDAHEVYRRVGFRPLAQPERWMELDLR